MKQMRLVKTDKGVYIGFFVYTFSKPSANLAKPETGC